MLDEVGGMAGYSERHAFRETLDRELAAPEVDPDDQESVSARVAYEREQRRRTPQALEQQRRQEAQLAAVTL